MMLTSVLARRGASSDVARPRPPERAQWIAGSSECFFAHVAVSRGMRCGADQGRAPRRARAWRIGTTLNAPVPRQEPGRFFPANPRSSRRRRAPRGTPPTPSLSHQCTGGETIVRGGCATAGRSARPRPPDLPPRARGRRAISLIAPETIAAPDPAFVADRIPRSRPRADPRGSPHLLNDLASAPRLLSHVQLSGYFSPPRRLHPLTLVSLLSIFRAQAASKEDLKGMVPDKKRAAPAKAAASRRLRGRPAG